MIPQKTWDGVLPKQVVRVENLLGEGEATPRLQTKIEK